MSRIDNELRELDSVVRRLTRDMKRLSVTEQVDVGYGLHLATQHLRLATDKMKDRLRESAAQLGTKALQGREGIATVTAPGLIMKMAKGANLDDLRKALGSEFEEFFEVREEVLLRSEALSEITSHNPRTKDIVFAAIEQDMGVGSVSFSRRKT